MLFLALVVRVLGNIKNICCSVITICSCRSKTNSKRSSGRKNNNNMNNARYKNSSICSRNNKYSNSPINRINLTEAYVKLACHISLSIKDM